VVSSSGCVTGPKGQEIGSTGYAGPTQRSLLIGHCVMATAEHREPCDSRGSFTVLGAPRGEIPPGDSTKRVSQNQRRTVMKSITLEEHFATPAFLNGPGRDLKEQAEKYNNARAIKLIPQRCDLGDKRIAEMDQAGIDMQIVSLTAPGVEQLEAPEAMALATETNDFVVGAFKKQPDSL